jgi:hypothetical protein
MEKPGNVKGDEPIKKMFGGQGMHDLNSYVAGTKPENKL